MQNPNYNHLTIEKEIYEYWEKNKFFKPKKNKKKYFSIVIPPPNVTGSLHMGHALNNSLQDLLVRYYRMNDYETLWQPGTDHAGIATQAVVEKQLSKKGISKNQLGRDNFVKEVWKWKEESGDQILNQLKKLGCSCDWSRNRFTMDKDLSEAVIKTFVQLYKKKLIYKDTKLVNWDTKLETAISDLEVEQKEVQSNLYYIKYKIVGEDGFLTIATTRPETMLGDTAVAVNPEDERYKNYIGKKIIVPIAERKVKIIADKYVSIDQGSGALKVTPAHDFNDFEIGKRHKLESINIFEKNGKLNHVVPKELIGLDRFVARNIIVKILKEKNLLEKVENIKNAVPFGDRSNSIIEPLLTEQWFVDAKYLAKKAIQVVKKKKTIFFPNNWTKTYFQWMNNIQPWCISRQLWWGHRIPAWYSKDKKIFVAENEHEANKIAKKYYKKNVELKRDKDVLDTWFSSALWPFATLGWPKKTYELKRFYPTSVLVTGFDIIFFWVARMMMMGNHLIKKEPFSKVYVHALVRDEKGQKMSKSKGNVIDPLDLIEKYSADALRFTLLSMASPGRDVKLSEDRIKGYRNFLNKIWNVNNFLIQNKCTYNNIEKPSELKVNINKWVYSEFLSIKDEIQNNINGYRFDEAAKNAYQFVWHSFCDWYLELSKTILFSNDLESINEVRNVASYIYREILIILHPFIPFITEEIWLKNKLDKNSSDFLMYANWSNEKPNKDSDYEDVNNLINIITSIRSFKNELGVSPGSLIDISLKNTSKDTNKFFNNNNVVLKKLGRIQNILDKELDKSSASLVINGELYKLYFDQDVDLNKIKQNLSNKYSKIKEEMDKINGRLSNKNFTDKAPKNIIDQEKTNFDNLEKDAKKIQLILESL